MSPAISRRRRLLFALGVLVVASLLRQAIMTVPDAIDQPWLDQPVSAVAVTVAGIVGPAVIVLGVYAALRVDRFERPLLVVAPVVFVVALLPGLVRWAVSGSIGTTATTVFLFGGAANAVQSAAVVVAVTLAVRAALGIQRPSPTDAFSPD